MKVKRPILLLPSVGVILAGLILIMTPITSIFIYMTVGTIPGIAAVREEIRDRHSLATKLAFLGHFARRLARARRIAIEITPSDGPPRIERVQSIAVGNNGYDEGLGRFFSRSRLNAGRLSVYVFKHLTFADTVRLGAEMLLGTWRQDEALEIGDPAKLGSVGAKSLIYYCCTTALAVIVGLSLVNIIRPGAGREALIQRSAPVEGRLAPGENEAAEPQEEPLSIGMRLQEKILPAIIRNPVMAGENPLVVILLALVLGAALATLGPAGEPALRVFQSLDKAFITIILWVMRLAPIGVFALMTCAVSDLGLVYMVTLAKYFCTVMLGLSLHFCLLCLVICPLLGGVSPRRFLRHMIPVFQVAFSTSSSSATLPVSIECVSKRVGADRDITQFMLPVGATINMDGTALYLTVAAVFISQVYGMDLGFQQQFMIFLTAILSSVGTAGIPGASIGLMGIVLASAGIPVEGIAIVIGVDRLLDMSRTVVNVTGDCVGVLVVSRSEGKMSA